MVFLWFATSVACTEPCDDVVIAWVLGEPAGVAHLSMLADEPLKNGRCRITFVHDTLGNLHDSERELVRAGDALALPGLVGVVGHFSSRASLLAAPLYNEAEILQLVPLGTSVRLQQAGPWTLPMVPDNDAQGHAIGEFLATELGAETVTIFYVTEEYGYAMRDVLTAEAEDRGLRILDAVPTPPEYQMVRRGDDTDLASLVTSALESGIPDVVVLVTGERAGLQIVDVVAEQHPDMLFVGGDGIIQSDSVLAKIPSMLDRIYVTTFWDRSTVDGAGTRFIEAYRQETGTRPTHEDALAHDAMLLLATAVQEVGSETEAVRDYLLSLGRTRPPYQGLTGEVAFTEDHRLPVLILRADSLWESR